MKHVIILTFSIISVANVQARRMESDHHVSHINDNFEYVLEDKQESYILTTYASIAQQASGLSIEAGTTATFPWLMLISLLGLVAFKVIQRSLDSSKQTLANYHDIVNIRLGAKPTP